MRSTFRLLFYVNRQKVKSNGNAPIMGRITVDGKVCQYATGQEVSPALWDPDEGRVVTGDKRAGKPVLAEQRRLKEINDRLDELERRAKATYKSCMEKIGYVSAEILKNAVTGKAQTQQTLIALFDEHNEEYAGRVGIDRVYHSYVRYLTARKHVYNFLQYKHDTEDFPLCSLDMQFINDFNFYLSTVLRLKTVSLNDYLIVLRKIARRAVKQRTVKRDPFAGHKMESAPKLHRHLSGEQLAKIMNAELPTYRLCHARDLFVFSTFTGLGRADLANLTTGNILTREDGSQWIHIKRQKTRAECHIKLLDIPIGIMNKYRGEGKDDHIFYVPVTSSLCRSLKMIERICVLDCHLTFYMARHSFATEICLSNGVPIETISKMMGHANIRTTQIYAEITNHKVTRDMDRLTARTKDLYRIPDDKMPTRVYRCGRYAGWKGEDAAG